MYCRYPEEECRMIQQSEEKFLEIAKLLSGEISEISFDRVFREPLEENGITTEGFSFSGKAHAVSEFIKIQGRIRAELSSVCARCLAPVSSPLEFEVELPVLTQEEDQTDEAGEEEEISLCDGEKINLFELGLEKLLLRFPFRLLCREDCKGLCPKCGKDLNTGSCGCQTKEIDPRLAGLADFFK